MSEKIEALDFVIAVLKEHEKRLDELVSRLERALKHLEQKDSGKYEAQKA